VQHPVLYAGDVSRLRLPFLTDRVEGRKNAKEPQTSKAEVCATRCATCHRAGQKPSSIHTLLLVTLPSMAR
jgi:cytochrome c553